MPGRLPGSGFGRGLGRRHRKVLAHRLDDGLSRVSNRDAAARWSRLARRWIGAGLGRTIRPVAGPVRLHWLYERRARHGERDVAPGTAMCSWPEEPAMRRPTCSTRRLTDLFLLRSWSTSDLAKQRRCLPPARSSSPAGTASGQPTTSERSTRPSRTGPPSRSASTASPNTTTAVGPGETPMPGDATKAGALVDAYEGALVAGNWREAWGMLSTADQAVWLSGDTSAVPLALRAQWGQPCRLRLRSGLPTSTAWPVATTCQCRLTMRPPSPSGPLVWAPLRAPISGVALSSGRDYPALAGNNAGWEMFLVAPDTNGDWRIWNVR